MLQNTKCEIIAAGIRDIHNLYESEFYVDDMLDEATFAAADANDAKSMFPLVRSLVVILIIAEVSQGHASCL